MQFQIARENKIKDLAYIEFLNFLIFLLALERKVCIRIAVQFLAILSQTVEFNPSSVGGTYSYPMRALLSRYDYIS